MKDATFVPISPNPFIVGNPVRGRTMFFGREAEFNLVRKRFEHSDHGGLLVFCGERRSGKTSILFQILDQRLGAGFIPVLIDMQSMAVRSEAEFLTRLSEEILAALGPAGETVARPDFGGETNRSATFQRFVHECLRAQPGRKLILLFDEYELFENKIDAGQLGEDVLYTLAGLMESALVFMIFTGSQHLEQRRRDYWNVLGKSIYKTVSYLEREDALSLIREPVAGRVRYDDAAVERILRLTAGQPFYTQAICQSLVDHLNEHQTNEVDAARVAEVVDGIINNPLPQMIFLWDGLERDDKLVMALLAECVEDGGSHAGVDDLLKHLKTRDYPLTLDRGAVATTLEKLYKGEMLLRSDAAAEPAYAFRMDLWRLWIRRQHSVWQVMREEGLAIRRAPRMRGRLTAAALGLVGILALVLLPGVWRRRPPGDASSLGAGGPRGYLVLEAQPEDAAIRMDGRRVGIGALRDSIAAGVDHRFELSAAGFADTAVTGRVEEGATLALTVPLRPLLGNLTIETAPSGADLRVDGRPAGRSPLTLRGLPVAKPHVVEASKAGFGVARSEVTLQPDATATTTLTLAQGTTDVVVTTEPSGSEIRVDGAARGTSPARLAALPLGRHVIRAAREGHDAAETTLVVTTDTRQVHLALVREAPGILVVRGERPAQIYVDGVLVVENVQNSGPRPLAPGEHAVRVILVSGEAIDQTVAVRSGERATFDFSTGAVTRRPEGGR